MLWARKCPPNRCAESLRITVRIFCVQRGVARDAGGQAVILQADVSGNNSAILKWPSSIAPSLRIRHLHCRVLQRGLEKIRSRDFSLHLISDLRWALSIRPYSDIQLYHRNERPAFADGAAGNRDRSAGRIGSSLSGCDRFDSRFELRTAYSRRTAENADWNGWFQTVFDCRVRRWKTLRRCR